jgi:hypothetical protein
MNHGNSITPLMNAAGLVLAIGMLAAAGCSRQDEAPRAYDAARTYAYLRNVGHVRALINADNRERIPAMIRSRDSVMLGAQGAKTAEYKRNLAGLAPDGVDPEALKFARNFEAILDWYRSVCMDSAELFREMSAGDPRSPALATAVPEIRIGTEANQGDTIGAVDSLLDSMGRADTGARAGSVYLQPILNKVRDDRDRLREAKAAHHDFTAKLKADLLKWYPGKDWNSKEILP